jgi:hypothetical protein
MYPRAFVYTPLLPICTPVSVWSYTVIETEPTSCAMQQQGRAQQCNTQPAMVTLTRNAQRRAAGGRKRRTR